MIKVMVRRSRDLRYLNDDPALELDGVREGPASRWLRGEGDLTSPWEAQRLLTSTPRSAVVGYDLIIAAPRPISILVALDESYAPAVVAGHRRSVADAVTYLERRALVVRDRRGGDDRDAAAEWERIAAYTHGVNRHGEPHLHDHVLVGARPRDEDRVLDARGLFAHARAADALYRATLRAELARTTPYAPWQSFEGVEHVKGLDEGYRALWGGHFDDRGAKRYVTRDDVRRQWSRDLERFVALGVVPAPSHQRNSLNEHAFAAAFEGRHEVHRHHVVEAWANAATFGASAHTIEGALDLMYPEVRAARGVRGPTLSVGRARMVASVRERGARPLDLAELTEWRQRTRDRSDPGWGRSR